jgi:hypothetical protein
LACFLAAFRSFFACLATFRCCFLSAFHSCIMALTSFLMAAASNLGAELDGPAAGPSFLAALI